VAGSCEKPRPIGRHRRTTPRPFGQKPPKSSLPLENQRTTPQKSFDWKVLMCNGLPESGRRTSTFCALLRAWAGDAGRKRAGMNDAGWGRNTGGISFARAARASSFASTPCFPRSWYQVRLPRMRGHRPGRHSSIVLQPRLHPGPLRMTSIMAGRNWTGE
jgi:hypothetical protein